MSGSVILTVCKASDPSKSSNGNMRHIPIHAEDGGGGVVSMHRFAQCRRSPTVPHISRPLQNTEGFIRTASGNERWTIHNITQHSSMCNTAQKSRRMLNQSLGEHRIRGFHIKSQSDGGRILRDELTGLY